MSTTTNIPTIYMTVAEMAERYVSKLETYDSLSYCQTVRIILNRQLVNDYGRMCINDFGLSEASAIVNRMKRVPYPNTLINLYCHIISAAFESERRNGRLLDNPWCHIQLPKREATERRVLSQREMCSLEEAFKHSAFGDYLGFIMHTGLKRTEASGVLINNWDREEHSLLITTHVDYSRTGGGQLRKDTYNGIIRSIPLSPEAESCMSQSLKQQSSCQETFPKWNNADGLAFTNHMGRTIKQQELRIAVRAVKELTGIADFSLGLLRNSFVASQLMRGVPVHVLQTYLGLKSREAILLYASAKSQGTHEAAQILESFFDEVAEGEST